MLAKGNIADSLQKNFVQHLQGELTKDNQYKRKMLGNFYNTCDCVHK